jgi:hypothetical protein
MGDTTQEMPLIPLCINDVDDSVQHIDQKYEKDITPEFLLQFRNNNLEPSPELLPYIDNKKKTKDMDLFWKRDFKPKNSWLIQTKLNQTDEDKLYSEINDMLNKLNKSNFDSICEGIMNMAITCREHMVKLVQRVIEEAIRNSLYINLYAKMCFVLMPYYITDIGEKIHFRDVLLSNCQETFEKYTKQKDDVEKNELIGIVKFIGELYNANILISSVIFMCFVSLYTNVMTKKVNSIEAISTLMTVVGKEYFQRDPVKAKSCYAKIEQIIQNGNIMAKEKFTILDLKELKEKECW